ncbi:caspase family protein [Leisingera caerulea]|uniref:Caspase family protein n=1 Tax=Leisingera caerulea TaxID=506591 RepID=A0A9Q9HM54_LEICA|nr:caspase family protein [Leisingera caerulea]UWQ54735.1 caspase family protein [Leisingera caerulea]
MAENDTERRIALVIGNSRYQHVTRLLNPSNDAKDLAKVLKEIGFEVTSGYDLDFRSMRLAIRDFSEQAEKADIVLVYFAGHGIEVGGENYLIPTNAELKRDRDVDFEAIRLEALLASLEASDGLKIVLVDACRNNPFSVQMASSNATRSIGRGLARIEPSGVLVGYAAKGGTFALDGKGRNSPYASALLKHLTEPGLELGKLFRKVRDTVYASTGGEQEPFVYGSLPGRDIFLVPPKLAAPTGEPAQTAALPETDSEVQKDYSRAASMNSVVGWMDFLSKHSDRTDHWLVKLAQERLAKVVAERDIRRGFSEREPWLTSAIAPDGETINLSRNDRVLVQKALNMMGFDVGSFDGQFGPKTKQAIAAARIRAGLFRGVEVDRALLRILPNVPAIEALQTDKAKVYSKDVLAEDLEPRLRKALGVYSHTPIKFEYFKGNLYLAVQSTSGDWNYANKTAQRAGGHLATISSAEENNFLLNLFSSDERFITRTGDGSLHGPLIGLIQADRSREPNGGWVWVTGEPVTFRGWSPGNPDNHRNRQHWARFYRSRKFSGTNVPVKYWDDTTSSLWSGGYLVEIE